MSEMTNSSSNFLLSSGLLTVSSSLTLNSKLLIHMPNSLHETNEVSCINIHKVLREMQKMVGKPHGFKHFLSKLESVHAFKKKCLIAIIAKNQRNFHHNLQTIRALSRENLFCEQHRRKPAYVSVQSNQHLCYLLFGKFHM